MILLNKDLREQAQIAIENATVIVFLTDIKTGLTASDQEVANMLLRSKKPIVLAVNKMDSIGALNPDYYEFYNLGLGDPIQVSSVHGHGTGDLLDVVLDYLPEETEEDEFVILKETEKEFLRPPRYYPARSERPLSPVSESAEISKCYMFFHQG